MLHRKFPAALPMQTRAEPLPADAVDAEARSVRVIFTTGATVRRRRYVGWDDSVPFDEQLLVSREAVNLERLNGGAPAVDSHSTWSTWTQVGVVERGWIEEAVGWALVRFPPEGIDEASDRLFALVAEKIVRNVSVGYSIDKVRIVAGEKKEDVEQHIIERWTPYEISFVTIGADAGAQVRAGRAAFPVEITPPAEPAIAASLAARMRMRQRHLLGR